MTLGALVLFFVVVLASMTTADERPPSAEKGSAESQRSASAPRTIKMTQKEFDDFLQHRKRCQQMIRGLGEETFIPAMEEARKKLCHPFVNVQLPDRSVAFSERRVVIALDRDDTHRLVESLPYFPETASVFVYYDDSPSDDVYQSMPYEATPVPNWLLKGLQKLPYLDKLFFQGGTFDMDAMAVIAEYPSLRELSLGRCRVTKEAFAELVKLKTLESLSVIAGLTPDCFITLAKLPRFRKFYFWGATDDFNKPIDDATLHAIESLNGRLESFGTSETAATIHASIVQALLKVKSLKELDIDSVGPGLTLREVEQLADLDKLTRLHLNLSWPSPEMSREDGVKARAIIWKTEKRADERAEKQQDQERKPPL